MRRPRCRSQNRKRSGRRTRGSWHRLRRLMKSHEIFQQMSPTLAAEIFTFLQTEQKPVYKAAIQGLANQRNLRGVFVERKPPAERFPWMQAAFARKISDSLAS